MSLSVLPVTDFVSPDRIGRNGVLYIFYVRHELGVRCGKDPAEILPYDSLKNVTISGVINRLDLPYRVRNIKNIETIRSVLYIRLQITP